MMNEKPNKWEKFKEPDDEIMITDAEAALPPQDKKTPEEITQLENALDQANLLAESRYNDYLRVVAEMDNLRRRAEKDVESAHKYALDKFVRELLPVVDSLEKALEHAADENIRQGVQMTLDILVKALLKFKVEAINPEGKPFNPAEQEAMSAVPNSNVPANTVLQVLQKGYLLHGRLVRPALVIISQ